MGLHHSDWNEVGTHGHFVLYFAKTNSDINHMVLLQGQRNQWNQIEDAGEKS